MLQRTQESPGKQPGLSVQGTMGGMEGALAVPGLLQDWSSMK
jgi:hypothetical protein